VYDVLVSANEYVKQDAFKDYPEFQKLKANVESNPGINKYLEAQAAQQQ
jgi:hypothetical protein